MTKDQKFIEEQNDIIEDLSDQVLFLTLELQKAKQDKKNVHYYTVSPLNHFNYVSNA